MSSLYQSFFANVYDRVVNKMEKGLFPIRHNLISDLKGEILEVGFGTGVNFKFYHPLANVIAIDPSKAMLKHAVKKLSNHSQIELITCGVGDEAYRAKLASKQFDTIICTLVLCTIPEPKNAINDFYQKLKPGGKLVVLEHIQHNHSFKAMLFNGFNPIWKRLADGCNLNRKTDELIKNAGFISESSMSEQYIKKSIPFYTNVFVKSKH